MPHPAPKAAASSKPTTQPNPQSEPKIAIVADWLTNMGGAEEVVLALAEAFPGAPIYTSTYVPSTMPRFGALDVRTTYLQRLPGPLKKLHKFLPMLRVKAFRRLDLSQYDVIISSASAEAKQVRTTRPGQVHICYCHTPIRYFWSHYHEYKADPGFGMLNPLVRLSMPLLVPPLKRADFAAAQDVDVFVANSHEVMNRIATHYQRQSTIIFPPVDTQRFTPQPQRGDYYVALGRQVPYKRIDLAVAACTKLGVPLRVYGSGSEHAKLRAMAGPTVEFFTDRHGDASDEAVAAALAGAKGLIFPSEEDFGIVQVEALAAGAPVIAFGKAGTLDIVQDGTTGILFHEQTVAAVIDAMQRAEQQHFDPTKLRRSTARFGKEKFITHMRELVQSQWQRRSHE